MAFWPSSVSFQIQYEITRVRQKMKDLALLHDKHMNRPTLDDSSEEEHAIEITTQEITQVQWFTKKANSFKLIFCWKSCVNLHLIINSFNWRTQSEEREHFMVQISARMISAPGSSFLITHSCDARCRCSIDASELWRVCTLVVVTAPNRKRGSWETWSRPWHRACRSSPPISGTRSPATWNVRAAKFSLPAVVSDFFVSSSRLCVILFFFVCCVYIPGMKNREERSKHFFDSGPLMEEDEDLAVYDKVLAVWNSY